MHFIYVATEEDRDRLLALGFKLIKTHPSNKIWVFENHEEALTFSKESSVEKACVNYIYSNTLTF